MQIAGKQQRKSVVQQISDNFKALQDDDVAEEQKQATLDLMTSYIDNSPGAQEKCKS